MGKELWTFLRDQIAAAAECILQMLNMLKANPAHFNNLMKINDSPYSIQSDNPSEEECTTAFLLTLFTWLEASIFTTMMHAVKPKGINQSTKACKVFCRLSWVCHCLMVVFPENFPNIRRNFAIMNNGQPTHTNILDLMPMKPGNLQKINCLMPFHSPRTFLACFGANKDGNFVVAHDTEGVVQSDLPPVSKVYHVMRHAKSFFSFGL